MPSSASSFIARAGTIVAACSASIGVKPGLDVQLDLAVDAVPGNAFVGADDDGHARIVQRLHDAQAALEARPRGRRVDARRAGVREQAVERRAESSTTPG